MSASAFVKPAPLYIDRHGRPHYPIMGASPDDPSNQDPDPGDPGPKVNEHGFPSNTPWTKMEPAQQTAYWRHQAQKHEGRADSRRDYDEIKAERDRLKAASQTPDQKAIDQARAEARTEAQREFGGQAVAIHVKALANVGRLSHDAAETVLAGIDKSQFLAADGNVDDDKLSKFLDIVAPQQADDGKQPGQPGQQQSRRDPHQGNKQSGGKASGLAAGAEMFATRKKTNTKTS